MGMTTILVRAGIALLWLYIGLVLVYVVTLFIPGDHPDAELKTLITRHQDLFMWVVRRFYKRPPD